MKAKLGTALIVVGFLMVLLAATTRPSGYTVVDRAAASKLAFACIAMMGDNCSPTTDCPYNVTGLWKPGGEIHTREQGLKYWCTAHGEEPPAGRTCNNQWKASGCNAPPE